MRQQVIPYVDNDIRNDWLAAMRSASDGVQTSYAMVIDRAAAAPAARFEFPVISGGRRSGAARPAGGRRVRTAGGRLRGDGGGRGAGAGRPPAGPAGAGRGLG
ncbi:putative conserved alanine and proline rich protein [Mycobacterium intracellulare 1956]|uniref:Putative conserved alanine and proline rich protein n=1 Tax=Mycobacterium intracellulare 1956 TaxID=1299331 RepID=X8CB62_MYCIT|nr:putative conserved alanine and proline rich protein [Mycobacterium intracellulare 1956]